MVLPSLLTLLHVPQLVFLRQADLLLEERPRSHPHQRVFSTSRAPSRVWLEFKEVLRSRTEHCKLRGKSWELERGAASDPPQPFSDAEM